MRSEFRKRFGACRRGAFFGAFADPRFSFSFRIAELECVEVADVKYNLCFFLKKTEQKQCFLTKSDWFLIGTDWFFHVFWLAPDLHRVAPPKTGEFWLAPHWHRLNFWWMSRRFLMVLEVYKENHKTFANFVWRFFLVPISCQSKLHSFWGCQSGANQVPIKTQGKTNRCQSKTNHFLKMKHWKKRSRFLMYPYI